MTGSLQATDEASAAVAVAPRVSLDEIEAKIADRYFATGNLIATHGDHDLIGKGTPANTHILTICMIAMKNGFIVIGKSAPASPENFNAQLGRNLAYEDAVRQLWPLEGYLLRDTLHNG